MTHRLVDAIAALDALRRERLDWLELHDGDQPSVTCHPHPYAGPAYGGALAAEPDLATQVEQLRDSGLVGTLTHDGSHVRLWDTPAERARWETRVRLSLAQPAAADLLCRGSELKVAAWRRDLAMQAVHEAVWAADALLGQGVKAGDLIDTSQISRRTYYAFIADRPADYTPPTYPAPEDTTGEHTAGEDTTPEEATGEDAAIGTAPDAGSATPATPDADQDAGQDAVEVVVEEPVAEQAPRPVKTQAPAKAPAKAPVKAPAPAVVRPAAAPAVRGSRAERGAAREVEDTEVQAAITWARERDQRWSEGRAAEAVARFHEVTGGVNWSVPVVVVNHLLEGHLKWPGAKAPKAADLGLYRQLNAALGGTDDFWGQREWIITPGAPGEGSMVVGCDVNAQYVAAASSVELGEGDPLHYEPGEPLPADVLKMPGWVRLGKTVAKAPRGLQLPKGLWVPTPLATYLTRDHGVQLDLAEALVWEHKRKALASLGRMFGTWTAELKGGTSQTDRDALAMVKSLYTRALGGYLMGKSGLTSDKWARPDWEALLVAQAEANFLRALDKLPDGCIPRAKYRDAVFVEVAPGAELAAWGNLDPAKPGKFKLMGNPVPGDWFADTTTAGEWQKAYHMGAD